MTEKPIIFNGDMVRAILDGRKTQTRRIVKGVPSTHDFQGWVLSSTSVNDEGKACWAIGKSPLLNHPIRVRCPFGEVGNRLWGRETCQAKELQSGLDVICYPSDGVGIPIKSHPIDAGNWVDLYRYRKGEGRIVPSIHMPRWASRITLEITGVRVERLQDISEEDAEGEGVFTDEMRPEEHDYKVNCHMCHQCLGTGLHAGLGANGGVIYDIDCQECDTAQKRFRNLWKSIYGDDSWQPNPWVWVIEFERLAKDGGQ